MSIVSKGIHYLEDRSCLTFVEHSPIELANKVNNTYIFFSYSGVLESCCIPFYTTTNGRRVSISRIQEFIYWCFLLSVSSFPLIIGCVSVPLNITIVFLQSPTRLTSVESTETLTGTYYGLMIFVVYYN